MILIQPPVVQNWNSLVNKPSILSDNQVSWDEIQNKPTTLTGYGITNALALTGGTITGDLISTSATPSTSPNTGALRVASLGVTGAIFAGTVSANSYNLIPIGRGGGSLITNTVTGVSALRNNTTGSSLSAFGVNSLLANTTGVGSTAVGVSALFSNTTGNYSTAVGANTLRSNTTGNYSTAVGSGTLQANTTGGFSSAFGANAGRYISDGVTGLTISNNSCFFGANTKGTQNATNENVFCFNATGNGSNTVTIGDIEITNNFFRGALSLNATQVVSTRRTGWAAPTGTPTRTTFTTSTVTLPELAERVKALIDDLITHGLIGA
jgi:trimeric autotransporter adhesin